VRTNLTITESDGTTTKINEPGAVIDEAALSALTAAILDRAASARWVCCPDRCRPACPTAGMPTWSRSLQPYGCKVAVDTSDAPLAALAAGFGRAAPDLIKPNSEELAGLAGVDPEHLETALAQGNPEPVVNAALQLIERGARTVLATPRCGGCGAGQRDRQLAGHPSPDQAQEHRRRR